MRLFDFYVTIKWDDLSIDDNLVSEFIQKVEISVGYVPKRLFGWYIWLKQRKQQENFKKYVISMNM